MIGALFVPLSKCSRGGKAERLPPPPAKTVVEKIFPRSDEQTDYDYGATRLGPSLNGVLTLIAFGWPLVLALCNRRGRRKTTLVDSLHGRTSAFRRNDLLDLRSDAFCHEALGRLPGFRPDRACMPWRRCSIFGGISPVPRAAINFLSRRGTR